jgi:hypothetical protein
MPSSLRVWVLSPLDPLSRGLLRDCVSRRLFRSRPVVDDGRLGVRGRFVAGYG